MKKLLFCISILFLLGGIVYSSAISVDNVPRPKYAADLVKIQLTGEAYRLANLPQGLYAEASSFRINELDQLMARVGGKAIIRAHIRMKDTAFEQRTGFDRWFLIKLDGRVPAEGAIQAFKSNRYIEKATPEGYAYTTAVPNDTFYANNWGHNNTAQLPAYTGDSHSGAGVGTTGFDADMQLAWDQSQGYGTDSTIIAIIDTGVDTSHPDLRLVTGYDYGDNDSNPMDDSAKRGHGTSCSGVAAAIANNALGITGAAGGCSVMPLKIANSSGRLGFTAIENALTHAGNNNVDIASMSFGSEGGTVEGNYPSTDTALEYAYSQGVTLLAATGNFNNSAIAYPSNHNKVISVGAASPCGQRKSYSSCDGETWWGSNYGNATPDDKEAVDIMGPTILPATDLVGTAGYNTSSSPEGDYYLWFNGTSCATPYVAGCAALLVSRDPSLTPDQVRTALTSTATDMTLDGGVGWDQYTGYGLVNANAALNSLIPGNPACSITSPAHGSIHDLNSTVTVTATASDQDGCITGVDFYIDDILKSTDTASPYTWDWDTAGYSVGDYVIKAIATDDDDKTASQTVTVYLVGAPDEGFETGDFTLFAWTNNSAVPWTVQNSETFSGAYAAKSGAIGNVDSTAVSLNIIVATAGELSFWKQVSSELSYDYLRFYIDGVKQDEWSGSVAWSDETYALTTGPHILRWTYYKDLYMPGGSDCAWLDHIIFPPLETYYAPPTGLMAVPGNAVVSLSWQAPGGGTPTGYKVYRNDTYLAPATGLTYHDNAVVNETTYSYYVTALYGEEESEPSDTVQATPSPSPTIQIGAGTATGQNLPVDPYFGYTYSQSIYLKSEVSIPGSITRLQWQYNGNSAWTDSIMIYMGQTSLNSFASTSSWIPLADLTQVYNGSLAVPAAPGWIELTLDPPFEYDNTQNLVIAVDENTYGYHLSGGEFYCSHVSGSRSIVFYNDYTNPDPASPPTSGYNLYTKSYVPNLKLTLLLSTNGADISVNPAALDYGDVVVGQTDVRQFTIQNSGDENLEGTITTPAGYTVALAARSTDGVAKASGATRDTLGFSIAPGDTSTFNLTFAPSAAISYNGNVVINSDAVNEPTVNLAVIGAGFIPPTVSIDNNTMSDTLAINAEGSDSFTISNSGSQDLTFTLVEDPAVDWFSASPVSDSVNGGGFRPVTGYFSAGELAPGTYNTSLLCNSNDPDDPQLVIEVELVVINTNPSMELPGSFSFGMNDSLVVDLAPYVDDADPQDLALDYSGNTNVLVSVDGLNVTFTAVRDWYGTEDITFSVYDGYACSYDTVAVSVLLNYLAPPAVTISVITGGVRLDWAAVENATAYEIYSSTDPHSAFALLGSTSDLYYEVTDTVPQEFYYVRAVNEPARTADPAEILKRRNQKRI